MSTLMRKFKQTAEDEAVSAHHKGVVAVLKGHRKPQKKRKQSEEEHSASVGVAPEASPRVQAPERQDEAAVDGEEDDRRSSDCSGAIRWGGGADGAADDLERSVVRVRKASRRKSEAVPVTGVLKFSPPEFNLRRLNPRELNSLMMGSDRVVCTSLLTAPLKEQSSIAKQLLHSGLPLSLPHAVPLVGYMDLDVERVTLVEMDTGAQRVSVFLSEFQRAYPPPFPMFFSLAITSAVLESLFALDGSGFKLQEEKLSFDAILIDVSSFRIMLSNWWPAAALKKADEDSMWVHRAVSRLLIQLLSMTLTDNIEDSFVSLMDGVKIHPDLKTFVANLHRGSLTPAEVMSHLDNTLVSMSPYMLIDRFFRCRSWICSLGYRYVIATSADASVLALLNKMGASSLQDVQAVVCDQSLTITIIRNDVSHSRFMLKLWSFCGIRSLSAGSTKEHVDFARNGFPVDSMDPRAAYVIPVAAIMPSTDSVFVARFGFHSVSSCQVFTSVIEAAKHALDLQNSLGRACSIVLCYALTRSSRNSIAVAADSSIVVRDTDCILPYAAISILS